MCRAVLLNFSIATSIWLTFCGIAFSGESPLVVAFDRFAPHNDVPSAEGGSLLLSELNCTACHQTDLSSLQPKGGPRLEATGLRLQSDWLKQFLTSPQKTKPGTTMPEVLAGLAGAEKQQAIAALAAFLESQVEPFPVLKATGAVPVPFEFWGTGDVELGKQLYHQVGCVACHKPAAEYETTEAAPTPIDTLLEQLDPEELEEMGLGSALRPIKSVPHGDLTAKYSRKSLTYFLLSPERTRPSGRMPSLKLSPMEAAHVAAYLLQDQKRLEEKTKADDQALVEEGKRLFAELGCVNCHTAAGVKTKLPAKPLAEIQIDNQENCLAAIAKTRPHYALDKTQTTAIAAALTNLPTKETPASKLQLKLLQLNCYACHERDELGGVGRNRKPYFETVRHIDIGDEGRLPPQLTSVGRKLTEKWLKTVFQGKGDVRPHVVVRMPRFPAAMVEDLPELFAKADRSEKPALKKVPAKPEDFVAAGRKLLGTGCVECHPVRGESLPGVVGIDMDGVTSRVEYGWFREFLLNPAELKKRTRMPTFFPNGESQDKSVLEGNMEQQIAAIWHYLREVKKQRLPEKIERARSQDFELVPAEKPILLRTFMHEAGTHALAVGFKEKVHFAFDTHRLRLAEAWRGRFLDAKGTWFERFTPPAVPLGEKLIAFPQGSVLAVLKDVNEAWPAIDDAEQGYRFEGYRLDAKGVPTLLYRVGDYVVQDSITPNDDDGLTRRLTISGNDKSSKLWLRGNVGERLQQSETSTTNEKGLTVKVSGEGLIRNNEELSEWLLPVKVNGETTIKLRYQW